MAAEYGIMLNGNFRRFSTTAAHEITHLALLNEQRQQLRNELAHLQSTSFAWPALLRMLFGFSAPQHGDESPELQLIEQNICQFNASYRVELIDVVAGYAIETQRRIWEVRKTIDVLSCAIQALLHHLFQLDGGHTVVSLERNWFLYHGSHPPKTATAEHGRLAPWARSRSLSA